MTSETFHGLACLAIFGVLSVFPFLWLVLAVLVILLGLLVVSTCEVDVFVLGFWSSLEESFPEWFEILPRLLVGHVGQLRFFFIC